MGVQLDAHIKAQSNLLVFAVILMSGCATLDKVEHPRLSSALASEIEQDLNLVNKEDENRLRFSGFLRIGHYSFEKYQYGQNGPRLILNASSNNSLNLHSLCYAHPISAMKGSVAGRTVLAFELLKHRTSDPLRRQLEQRGIYLSEYEGEDAMCFRLVFGEPEHLLDTLAAHLAIFSDLDYERGHDAFDSAIQRLSEPPSSLYKILTSHADQIRYRNIDDGTRYGIPQLTSKVSLIERKSNKELRDVRASYYPSQLVSIIVTKLSRRTVLEQFRAKIKTNLREDELVTQTSSSTFTRLAERLATESRRQEKAKPIKQLPGVKGIDGNYLLLSWVLPKQYDEDYLPLRVASELLAHRWTLSPRLEIHTHPRRFGGRFDILSHLPGTLTSTHAITHVRQLIADISTHSEVDQEISRIKKKLKVKFLSRQSSPLTFVQEVEKFELIHGDFEHLRDEELALRRVDRNQVVRVLSEYLLLQAPIVISIKERR